ncbi:MAG: T9SS type A sorting domain-containing protein [Lewinellaceae bacterium]|nr:T9SS type A sorting domain-containing protein [Lewinellaceae bacterium]
MKSNFCTLLLALVATSLSGQNASWQHFYPNTAANGLAARGNTILVATDFGLARLDTLGNATYYDPVNSGLPFRQAKKVAIDQAGDWWVTHPGGVAQYDGSNWTNWDTTQMGLSFWTSNATVLETSPDGRVGVGTSSRGAAVFENNTWTSLTTTNSGLPSNNIRGITFGADGKIYFATNAGLAVLDGVVWTVYNTTNTGITGFSDCKSVALTSAGIVWVTIGSNRFAKLEAGVWTDYTSAAIGLPGVGFSLNVIVDTQDRLWLAFSKSISVLEAGNWTHYLESDIGCTLPVLPTTQFQPVVDGAGQYWFWSSNCGLTQFDGQIWEKHTTTGNAPLTSVYALTQDTAGNMWFVGNGQSIAKKEGDTWQTFNPMALGLSEPVTEIWAAHGDPFGNVWFPMITGEILRFDGAGWTMFDTVAKTRDIFDTWFAASAPDGSIWFSFLENSTYRSVLVRYQNGAWTFFSAPDIPVLSDKIFSSVAFGDSNVIWFRAYNDLVKYDGSNWEEIALPNPSGPSLSSVRKIDTAPDGALWVATENGLDRFDGANWTNLSLANSDIPTNDIFSVDFDRAGGMYISYDPFTFFDVESHCAVYRGGVWTKLVPPGYESAFNLEPWATFVDRDNRFWFTGHPAGTDYGVFMYDPMLVRAYEVPSPGRQLHVFPNPATDVVYLQLSDWENLPVQIAVRNAQGKLLYQQTKTPEDQVVLLRLSADWPAGIYYLEAVNEKGERQTGRFVRVR